MVKTNAGYRIVLHLDPRMALESMVLNQLDRVPRTRRQEWLRGLLVKGFSSECLALNGGSGNRERRSGTAFTQWLVDESQSAVTSKQEPPQLQTRLPQTKADGKPFAALGKVIG